MTYTKLTNLLQIKIIEKNEHVSMNIDPSKVEYWIKEYNKNGNLARLRTQFTKHKDFLSLVCKKLDNLDRQPVVDDLIEKIWK